MSRLFEAAEPAPAAELEPADPCLITFTSGTTGEPTGVVHGQRYLPGQRLQAEHWLDARPGDLVWCTAATGWSKSARNTFIAPWLRGRRGAAARRAVRSGAATRAARLRAGQRAVHGPDRVPRDRQAGRDRAAARAALAGGRRRGAQPGGDPRPSAKTTGLEIRDGYGQTETGQLTGNPPGEPVRPGSMGRPLPGVDLRVRGRRAGAGRPGHRPHVLRRLPRRHAARRPNARGRPATGSASDDDGYLYFEGRTDDVIISAGYRIGPFEVESALVSHAAVAEAAVVAAPDEERGAVVRAVVVLRDGFAPGRRARRRATGARQARRPRRTSTRGSSTSPTSCPRRRRERSSGLA